MKRLVIILAVLAILLTGCTYKDIDVYQSSYVNTDDTWTVNSRNKFYCTGATTVRNDDGTYTVTFTFEKIDPMNEGE